MLKCDIKYGIVFQVVIGKINDLPFFLYMLSTLIAAFVAVCMNFIFKVKVPLTGIENVAEDLTPPGSVFEVLKNLCLSFVTNPINAIANANYIAILFWAVLVGLALKVSGDGTKAFFRDLADALSVVVRWVINCAPAEFYSWQKEGRELPAVINGHKMSS